MIRFYTELLREKFTIANAHTKLNVMSNRLHCPLTNQDGILEEDIVIRGKNLYNCVRMMGKILESYEVGGSLVKRKNGFDWNKLWNGCQSQYEKDFKDNNWIIVYYKGKPLFRDGDYHPFLDMIEKCAPKEEETKESYDQAVHRAEEAFRQLGKSFTIHHDSNTAMKLSIKQPSVSCSNILRKDGKIQTYNFSCDLQSGEEKLQSYIPFILSSAATAEAMQLSFTVGRLAGKQAQGQIKRGSTEAKFLTKSQQRIERLKAEIANLEMNNKIRYRPEKPDFDFMIAQAKRSFA